MKTRFGQNVQCITCSGSSPAVKHILQPGSLASFIGVVSIVIVILLLEQCVFDLFFVRLIVWVMRGRQSSIL